MSSGVAGKAFDFKLLKRVFSYVRPYRTLFILAVTFTITLAAVSIVRPMIIRNMMSDYVETTPGSEAEKLTFLSAMLYFTIILLATLVVETLMQYFNTIITNRIGQGIVRDIRVEIHEKILHFRPKYFDTTPIGQLVTRSISDLESISDVFSQGFIVILGDLLMILIFLVAMLVVNWKITLVVLTTIPVMFIATWIFKNAVKAAFNDVRNAVSQLNTFVQEHITGMKIVQVFSREKAEMERFRKINEKHRDANIKSVWHYSVFFPVVEILASISLGLLVWYGGRKVFDLEMSVGDITFFIMLINMFFRPIRMLADRVNTLQMGMVASERVFKVLDTDEMIADTGKADAAALRGDLSFSDVWFAYKDESWVLRGISFEVKAGETIAIVGATGSGKTTVINLINRFYEYNKGSIKIDGTDVREYELQSLRSSIGVVLQDVFLFSGSILDNITLMNESISRESVIAASKAVGAHEFIMQLPGDYDYKVMERGSMLSVGQRQLIAFIRAYVYNPRILVLDEATSSIDTESEIRIQKATETLTKGRTSIVIAHRLATIQKASRILVMDHGNIIESGTHHELLAQNGQYKKLFELQFKHEKVYE